MICYWSSELHKDVELKRFIAQLRKEILAEEGATSEEGMVSYETIRCCYSSHTCILHIHTYTHYVVDKVLNDICRDLKESGLYFKYMQDNGADE